MTYWVLIGLSLVLLLAIGWVLFAVGRVIVSIICEARAKRQPSHRIQHPEFGTLTLDSELWSGRVRQNGREFGFVVAGTESAPDEVLLGEVRVALDRLTELERLAVEYIYSQELKIRREDLTLESLAYLWEDKPDQFAMEFALAGDDDGVWRVEFEAGQPKYFGRDD